MEKIKVKRVIEVLQDCNPEADFEITCCDGQIPARDIFVSVGHKNSEEKKENSIPMNAKNCDTVTFNIEIE